MNPAGSFSWSTRSPFFTASAAGGPGVARHAAPAASPSLRSAREPRRRIRQWRSGEAVPGDGAAPCRPPRNLLAADARVLFPIARAASRGLAQPGFNEVAPCVASSAAGVARPHRNLSVIKSKSGQGRGRGSNTHQGSVLARSVSKREAITQTPNPHPLDDSIEV